MKFELQKRSVVDFCMPLHSLIQTYSFQKDVIVEGTTRQNTIIFLLKGSCLFRSDIHHSKEITALMAIFLPAGSIFTINNLEEDLSLMVFHIDLFQKLRGSFSLKDLYLTKSKAKPEHTGFLTIEPILKNYLENLNEYITNNFDCPGYFEIKIQELLLILHHFYTIEDLAAFFNPILNKDYRFASFILENWQNVKTAQELAQLSHYSETSFGKKFKQVFGISPYQWIQKKRCGQIYYKITNTIKPFKLIAEEHNFKSLQHFNDYCQRYFSETPGSLRKK